MLAPLTPEDSAVFQRLPHWLVCAYFHAFVADAHVMNARSRVAASPLFKELMVMRLRAMNRQAELHRKFLLNRYGGSLR